MGDVEAIYARPRNRNGWFWLGCSGGESRAAIGQEDALRLARET